MQTTIQYIKKELADLYSKTEISGFVRIIFEFICGLSYTGLILQKDIKITSSQLIQIEAIVQRLKRFEPIQYILGETEFYGLKLKVNPDILIPRPETEELVQWMTESLWPNNPAILDVGAGSGCIALALKKQLPEAKISAVDFSAEVLKTAIENAEINELEVEFIHFDVLQWSKRNWPYFDGIVSNPPYVRELEKKQMHPNVLKYEPETALYVPDEDPLIFYREIGHFALHYLKPGGNLFFEINENFGIETVQLLKHIGFKNIILRKDIHGKNRMVKGVK
ncbi:MAG TPA: peptide chain release factor N(5)-glutamine methyltransferase [Draconibacterium sp.]|nr:peptide chain release factor N(5)-glutamine methyltransferase [Draconibacterium sp.]